MGEVILFPTDRSRPPVEIVTGADVPIRKLAAVLGIRNPWLIEAVGNEAPFKRPFEIGPDRDPRDPMQSVVRRLSWDTEEGEINTNIAFAQAVLDEAHGRATLVQPPNVAGESTILELTTSGVESRVFTDKERAPVKQAHKLAVDFIAQLPKGEVGHRIAAREGFISDEG